MRKAWHIGSDYRPVHTTDNLPGGSTCRPPTELPSVPLPLEFPSRNPIRGVKYRDVEKRMLVPRLAFGLLFLGAITTLSPAQAPGTGFPVFNSFAQHGLDTVNEGNLNVVLEIPIFSKAGRGLPLSYVLTYNT